MTEQHSASLGGPGLASAPTWDDAPYPALVADRAGALVAVNRAAGTLFSGAAPGRALDGVVPHWLAAAHDVASHLPSPGRSPESGSAGGTAMAAGNAQAASAAGLVGLRSFEAHPTLGADGSVLWWLVDDTDRLFAQRALDAERERTAFLAEASNLLLSSLNVERCMEVTAQLAAQYLADAAVVVAPSSGRIFPVTTCGVSGQVFHEDLELDPTAVPGLAEALQGFPPVPSRWIDPGTLPEWAVPERLAGGSGVGSVVVTPLPGQGVPAGALILLRQTDHARFTDSEEVFARLFAARAGAALAAARMYTEQSIITATLLRELLPPRLHHVRGVDYAGGYRASRRTELVGGDFYDVHPGVDDEAETLAVLGDVCGKGLDAAVLTGKIRTALAALLPLADDHQRMLELLNNALIGDHCRFATLVLASVRRHAGHARLRLTSAGHLPPLVVRADGRVEEVATSGSLIGVLPSITSTTAELMLAPGDMCVLYTDGVTEARGGPLGDELFGEQRLSRSLVECAGLPAEAVAERIQMLAAEWVGPTGPADDIAVLAISVPRSTHLSAVDGRTRGRYTA